MGIRPTVNGMAKQPTKTELKQMAAGERILDAAVEAFAAHGFESAKVSEIAKRARVAVGTIYLRYPNKAALLGGVLRKCEQLYVDAMFREEVVKLPFPERFHAMFGSLLSAAAGDERIAQLMPIASYAKFDDWMPGDDVRAAIMEVIEEGQKNGVFRENLNPSIVAAIAHGMVEGSMHAMIRASPAEPELMIQHLSEASFRWLMSDQKWMRSERF